MISDDYLAVLSPELSWELPIATKGEILKLEDALNQTKMHVRAEMAWIYDMQGDWEGRDGFSGLYSRWNKGRVKGTRE